MVKYGDRWELRFCRVLHGCMIMFRRGRVLNFDVSAPLIPFQTVTLAEAERPQQNKEVIFSFQILESSETCPPLLCTQAQADMFKASLSNKERPPRLFICFIASGGGPEKFRPVCVRLTNKTMTVVELLDPVEYTLLALHLEATDVAVTVDFPYGLEMTSEKWDEMILPIQNMQLAAQTPYIILQWLGALRLADLEPLNNTANAAASAARTSRTSGRERSNSLAVVDQLVSGAVGIKTGSFGSLGDFAASPNGSAAQQKANLTAQLRAIPWDARTDPHTVQQILQVPWEAETLSNFCKTIFTEENVSFCIMVEKFRSTRDVTARQQLAKDIVAEFISYSGKSVVTLDGAVRKRIEEMVGSKATIPLQIFDPAIAQVVKLIELESYPKFIQRLADVQHVASNLGKESPPSKEYDSDDSSSFEERQRSSARTSSSGVASTEPGHASIPGAAPLPKVTAANRHGRSDSLAGLATSSFGGEDFGSSSLEVRNVEQIRAEVSAAIDFDPINDPPRLFVLLAKKGTRALLQKFAGTILCDENVMFWERVHQFKAAEAAKRGAFLQELMEDFIPVTGKRMVNIRGVERARLLELWKSNGLNLVDDGALFDTALAEITKVMEMDLYPKFMNLAASAPRSGATTPSSASTGLARFFSSKDNKPLPPLWEILNDPEELNSLLIYAASVNQQDDVLFWCLVQRFRTETSSEVRLKLATHIVQNYVTPEAPRMVRVDKAKKSACLDRYLSLPGGDTSHYLVPEDLFDALWRDVQASMNKHLYPAYEKSLKKHKTVRASGSDGALLKDELAEAMQQNQVRRSWVPVVKTQLSTGAAPQLVAPGKGRSRVPIVSGTPPKEKAAGL